LFTAWNICIVVALFMAVWAFTYQYSICLIVHATDLHLKNILFHSPSIGSWSSQEEVYTYLEPPGRWEVFLSGAKEPAPSSPHVPAYIVPTPDPTSLLKLCLSDPSQVNIRICDFSESFIYSPGIRRTLHTPMVYAAPEILLDDDPSPASDVWACAVLVYSLVSAGSFLFPSYRGISNEVLRSMTLSLGKLPEHLWLKWADRGQYFDESGQWLADPKSLPRFGRVCSSRMNEEEKIRFELMIKTMVAYEPRERVTMAEVVKLIPDTWLC
jgi:serine/threonine protein kinase